MGLYGRGYDQSYRYSDPSRGWSYGDAPYRSRYGSDYASREREGMGRSSYPAGSSMRYGEEYRGRGYDRSYHNRWQTDYGDPFGDRIQHTPIRFIGESRGYDRGYFANDYGRSRDRTNYPVGNMPYARRAGYDAGYRQRTAGSFDRYDRDWY